MTKQMEELLENNEQNRVVAMSRKLFLAGLGAVVLTQEELSKLANRFVEQGEETEKQARKRVNDLFEARRKDMKVARKEADKRLDKTLHAINVPTRSDIERLNRKITQLNKKLEDLEKTAA
ncbi:MAG TPA: phasin family protein [Anaerolineae bacterium]